MRKFLGITAVAFSLFAGHCAAVAPAMAGTSVDCITVSRTTAP
jgi:hypothetical protein